jgi:hypothetical protein
MDQSCLQHADSFHTQRNSRLLLCYPLLDQEATGTAKQEIWAPFLYRLHVK